MINLPEGYVEREPAPELDLISRMHGRFKGTGQIMPASQRNIYTGIKDMFIEDVKRWRGYPKQIHKPTVVDVGCGVGVGSNILSQEAQFVWGIDINKESIDFAQQAFGREPNNIYYTPQVTFDVVNILDEPREVMWFDYVVCVEVIEHIPREQAEELVKGLNRFVKRNKKNGNYIDDETRTKIFVSTPNRNNPRIQDNTPFNEHHCYEATAGELYDFFTKHYQAVTVLDENLQPQELDTEATPLVFKLENPLK